MPVVHYEYYDGSSWCGKYGNVQSMWHPDDWTRFAPNGNPLLSVTCKDCLNKIHEFGQAAKDQECQL